MEVNFKIISLPNYFASTFPILYILRDCKWWIIPPYISRVGKNLTVLALMTSGIFMKSKIISINCGASQLISYKFDLKRPKKRLETTGKRTMMNEIQTFQVKREILSQEDLFLFLC